MKFLAENWYTVVAFAAIIALAILYVIAFVKKPRSQQIRAVKEWLLLAVIEAEKQLGSGTGVLKLRQVYDLFVSKYPAIACWISFNTFSDWVDEALDKMRKLLQSNEAIKDYVSNTDPSEKEA